MYKTLKLIDLLVTRVLKLQNFSNRNLYEVKPRSKASTYKAMPAYKAFFGNPKIIFCITFYIGYKAFSL